MHDPALLAEPAWLTFGRVRPAHLNAVIFGWASQVGIGVSIWLLARLCRVRLQARELVIGAGVLWNIGVFVGIVGILAGHSQGVEWLEFPQYSTFILFLAYALIGIWSVVMFRFRRPGHVYVSEWYLLAAFFWFPWLYATANVLILMAPVQGVVQAATNWWFAHNVLGLWFTPIGLAAAYYMIPKVIGRPVHSYYLSALGFWSLALFYSWNGMHHLIGGPLPAWLITASVVASVMMIIPVLTVAINHHMTMKGQFGMLKFSPTLRFVVFGAMCYTFVSLQGISMAIRPWNQITHFTHYTIGHSHLGVYGFFSMIMFGCMYYIVPRLTQCEWRSPILIKLHFWFCFYGLLTMAFALGVGGLIQGVQMANPNISFNNVLEGTLPWLKARSISGILLSIGHMLFAYHFVLMLVGLGRKSGNPTYLNPEKEMAAHV
jgi:cytochrome c oxidase cbb3-type subunit 1